MDLNAIVDFISKVGFPVAGCIAMFMMMDKERLSHKDEMKQVTDAVNNNTLALQKLIDKLDEY